MTKDYDIIIVGGGSAGCVLAARLSENPDTSVLLIEAGSPDRHPLYRIPAGFAKMTKGMGSWGWHTVPQRHMNDRIIRFTQARVLGGGSTINAQIYTRGNRHDFDEWCRLGCTGWSYADVLPYFLKSENNDTFDNRYHAKGGPLSVSQPTSPLPICEAYFEAARQLGIPRNYDFAGESQDGVGYYQLTQHNGSRSSAAVAFLKPAMGRPNLTVRTRTQALRVMVEKGKAYGVEVAADNQVKHAYANQEIILSAGAIGSPRLLMLSGIGPADHLRAVGIDVVLDKPEVGSNLQDHLDIFTVSECTGEHTYDKYARWYWSVLAGLQYLLTKGGPVASSLFETGGFWYVEEGERYPDVQLHLGLGSGIEAGVAKMQHSGVTLNSAYLRPRSRGTVRLASDDPSMGPLLDPNYWEDPHDRVMSIRGLKLAQRIMRQEALHAFVLRQVLPGPEVHTDKDYFDFACSHAKTDHHPAGTCRMGGDEDSVVDPCLRCRGIEGLRIVDASVMPRLVSSNTNATTIMIAEKATDMIRAV